MRRVVSAALRRTVNIPTSRKMGEKRVTRQPKRKQVPHGASAPFEMTDISGGYPPILYLSEEVHWADSI
jgi:hypothetical protein